MSAGFRLSMTALLDNIEQLAYLLGFRIVAKMSNAEYCADTIRIVLLNHAVKQPKSTRKMVNFLGTSQSRITRLQFTHKHVELKLTHMVISINRWQYYFLLVESC